MEENHPPLVNNYDQSLNRLLAVERSLKRSPQKVAAYCKAMTQYVHSGHVPKVDKEGDEAETVRYLPHYAVFREDKTTTKCRIVFDGSCKTPDGVSLNCRH